MSVEELEDRVDELESKVNDLIAIMKPIAIGSEQIWEIVFEDILKQDVPCGPDVRSMANRLSRL